MSSSGVVQAEVSAAVADEAIRLGQSGLTHYQTEQWDLALSAFQAADAQMHSPVFGLYVARCLRKLGRWVAAVEQYQSMTSAQLSDTSPEPWKHAHRAATEELADLSATVPKVQLSVEGVARETIAVSIDGKPIQLGATSAILTLDPGDHVLHVISEGKLAETREFTLQPAQEPLGIELGPYSIEKVTPLSRKSQLVTSHARLVTPRPAPTPSVEPVAKNHAVSTIRRVGTVALGAGFLGLAGGIVIGAYAWHERNAISSRCDNWDCPKSLSARIERGRTIANIATAAFSLALVGFGTASVLFYVEPNTPRTLRVGTGWVTVPLGLEVGITSKF
ncbi:MAG TPA: hypothetical protein VIV60_27595 [Polyangiaceae bacterium]